MKPDREETILKAQREFVSYVLTVAESSLHPSQFDAFKRLVLDQFHASLKPVVLQSLSKEQTRPGAMPQQCKQGKKGDVHEGWIKN